MPNSSLPLRPLLLRPVHLTGLPLRSAARMGLRRILAALLLPLLLSACADDSGGGAGAGGGGGINSPAMAAIRSRGQLSCGVDGTVAGFSSVDSQGRYQGLDVDLCRALAAVLLGDPAKVSFRNLTLVERFAAVSSGDVDLLSRNTTVTLSRDATGGNALTFAPVMFHDGTGALVPQASGITSLSGLAGKPVCLTNGGTTEQALTDWMRQRGLRYSPLKFATIEESFTAYEGGRCSGVAIDRSILAAQRSGFADPSAHRLLPETFSKEPQAPATPQTDPAWADAVRWVVYALIEAEERGITQANVEERLAAAKADPKQADLRRFLGVEGEMGRQLGLSDDFVVRAIRAVGNYGEIYERNVGMGSPLKIERGANRLARDGGLMVAPPFR